MAGQHKDPLARLLAPRQTAGPQPLPPPPAAAGAIVVKQADGHGAVRFRRQIGARSHKVIPDGEQLHVLREEGEWARVVWKGEGGYVKLRNLEKKAPAAVVPQPQPVPPPSAAAAAAPVAPRAQTATASVCTVVVDGATYTIDPDRDGVTGLTTVHDWISDKVAGSRLRRNCGIGFCGACINMLTYKDPASGQQVHRAFNSCLRPILNCNGMSITTIKGVGTSAKPHPTQKALADNAGTQCGYCSSAVVMNLYSHLAATSGKPQQSDALERIMDSNVCRCTGYRPILDTYKSFASNPPTPSPAPSFGSDVQPMAGPVPQGPITCPVPRMPNAKPLRVESDGVQWFAPTTEADLQATLKELSSTSPLPSVFLVGGRTSVGIWDAKPSDAYVEMQGIASLRATASDTTAGMTIGASVTMHDAIEFLRSVATGGQAGPSAEVLSRVVDHLQLSPGHTIRNMGTIGGNVMLSHEHQTDGKDFPLEFPLMFMALDAKYTVVDAGGNATTLEAEAFYSTDMSFKYLQKVTIPWAAPGTVFRSYRDSKRHVYSHAVLAAAMVLRLDGGKPVAGSARVVFNNIQPRPSRMKQTEALVEGGDPTDNARFQASVLPGLVKEAEPVTAFGDKDYRRGLVQSYIYKFYLALQPSLPTSLAAASKAWLPRAVTSASQSIPKPDPSVAPLNEAFPKMDSLLQTTGEAEYVRDIPVPGGCLHTGLVFAESLGDFTLDTAAAEALPGFVKLLTAADIAAETNAKSVYAGHHILADKTTQFIGQIIGIALADSWEQARKIAKAVKVNYYSNTRTPVLTVSDAVDKKYFFPAGSISPEAFKYGDASGAFSTADKVTEFTFEMGHQYHYHMETQSMLARPTEDGISVHAATQVPNFTQTTIAQTTGLPLASVDLQVRRCGGGFGGKLDNAMFSAQLCSLAAWSVKRPVRLIMEIEENMRTTGLRAEWMFKMKVGVMNDGEITAIQSQAYLNSGTSLMPLGAAFAPSILIPAVDNVYNVKNWDISITATKTDIPGTTSMRAPGWLPGLYSMERVITEAAAAVGKTVDDVRARNLYKKGDVTPYQLTLKDWNVPAQPVQEGGRDAVPIDPEGLERAG
eukprot:Hpha_TRINITY_DN14965_c1_g1::TRINITY_DN14965_c1_g1_i1::g.144018::m.144018/K00106/XDH; xanthine dehydrogenase/oxidase